MNITCHDRINKRIILHNFCNSLTILYNSFSIGTDENIHIYVYFLYIHIYVYVYTQTHTI